MPLPLSEPTSATPPGGLLRRTWSGSIRRRLVVGLTAYIALAMSLVVALTAARQRDFLVVRSEERGLALVKALATSSTPWVLAQDIQGLQELVGSTREFPDVRYVMVLSPEGRVLAHGAEREVGRFASDAASRALLEGPRVPRVVVRSETSIDVAAPIVTKGTLIGWARAGFGQEVVLAGVRAVALEAISFALLAVAFGAGLATLLARGLTQGLEELVERSRLVSAGKPGVRFGGPREDEIGALGRAFDVMTEALAESERKARQLIEALPAAVVIHGPDSVIRYGNSAARVFLGLTEDQLLGRSAIDPGWYFLREDGTRMPVDEYPATWVIAQRAPLRDQVIGLAAPDEDGPKGVRWAFLNAFPELDADGRVARVVVTFVDITERRRAEEALRESEARASEAQRIGHLGNAELDLERNLLILSDEACRILELPRAPEGHPVEALHALIHPEDRAQVLAAHADSVSRRAPYDIVHRLLMPDGRVKYVATRSELILDSGKPVRALGTIHDITALKMAEDAVRDLNRQLEQRVEERTAELAAANQELESFSYSVSHDLRAPLRAIDGFSRILQEDYKDRLDAEGQRLLKVVRDSTVHMGHLIDDILGFSRMGRREMQSTVLDMTELARGVFAELSAQSPGRRLRFELGTLPPARGDRTMIRQVLVNLVSNAIKFSHRPSLEEAVIEVGSRCEDGEIQYFVRDNGVGFDMRYADKLFGVFQRLHSTTEFEGTGIGLAIVKRVVNRHGGRVWAQAAPNEGATFFFTLPESGEALAAPGISKGAAA